MNNMKLVELQELFDFKSGVSSASVTREHSKLSNDYIHFVRPSHRQDTSIDAYIDKRSVSNNQVFPADTIYVSTNGQGSHTFSYVATEEFAPNSDVYALLPKRKMSVEEKLYYAFCITKNRYRFNYNRKPKGNRLMKILVPKQMPDAWKKTINVDKIKKITKPAQNLPTPKLKVADWKFYRLGDLFDIKKGKRLTLADQESGNIPYISSSGMNNGLDNMVSNGYTDENCLSFACYGTIGEVFYQKQKSWISDNCNALYLREKELTPEIALFLTTILKQEKYRFSYGVTAKMERLKEFQVKLPTQDGKPDYDFMSNFIQTLPFSSQICSK